MSPDPRGGNSDTSARRQTGPDGLVIVDKPQGWTSHDVVGRVRRLAGTRKVGHAGTLDPMATGVLVVGIGRATRLLTYVVGADKDYRATVRLGVATSTDDAEGQTLAAVGASRVDDGALRSAVAGLTGRIVQVPSAVSAIKVDGKRSYARVRAGEDVDLEGRLVTVSRFEIGAGRPARTDDGVPVWDVDVEVTCSSGTYVRALARDLGAELGVGGHLVALRRTRVGGYSIDAAATLDTLAEQVARDGALSMLPLADAARAVFPARVLSDAEARALAYGQWIGPSEGEGTTAGYSVSGELIALLEPARRDDAHMARPVLVFAPARARAT